MFACRHYIKVGYFLLWLVALFSTLMAIRNAWCGPAASLDFDVLYGAAKAISYQLNPYTSYPHLPETHVAFYTPSGLLALTPLSLLPSLWARAVWIVLNVIATAIIIWGVHRWHNPENLGWKTPSLWILLGLFVTTTPWRVTIGNGQLSLNCLSGIILGYWLSTCKRPLFAGIALAIGLIKYPATGLFLLFFVKKKHWPTVGVATGIHLTLLCIAGIWTHTSPLTLILHSLYAGGTSLLSSGFADLGVFLGHSQGLYLFSVLTLIALYGLAVFQNRHRPAGYLASLTALTSLLVTYHRIYDYVLLIFPLGWLIYHVAAGTKSHTRETWVWGVLLAVVFWGERLAAGSALYPLVQISVLGLGITALLLAIFQKKTPDIARF